MPEPVFKRKPRSALTFNEDCYFARLVENAALITGTLQLGQDEAGVLDKQLSPDLLHVVGRIMELLSDPEYREDAERELAAQNDPDTAIAILRQAFRVRSGRVNDLLVRKLTELCQSDESGVAREAIHEATGSELERLSQLADEGFLNIGTEAELQQIAADPRRTLNVRVRACHLLIEQHRRADAVPIALGLYVEGAEQPAARELLRRLSRTFGALGTLDGSVVQEQVVAPLLEQLQRYERNDQVRQHLLWAIRELHKPVLEYVHEIPTWQIRREDMWLALTLRQCAIQSPAATQLMIYWMGNQEVDDFFRLRLSRRIRDKRVKFPQGAEDDLKALLNELPYRYEEEMRQNIEEVIRNATGKAEIRPPKELYAEILKQYCEDGDVEDGLLWDFRHTRGSLSYVGSRLRRMEGEELELLLKIVYHERFKGHWAERLQIVLDAYSRLTPTMKREALHVVYELARNEPQTSKDWRRAKEFLAQLVDAGGEDSELARQYWKKLGEQR
jgi:hypothetical protein